MRNANPRAWVLVALEGVSCRAAAVTPPASLTTTARSPVLDIGCAQQT